ncbi:MAG: hypothetical protein K0Q74_249 [Gammaproteobacteria bacterium]|jgi:hypothetical protein|nr:hypothetical protein [Gammaproteobacteria bacterium]
MKLRQIICLTLSMLCITTLHAQTSSSKKLAPNDFAYGLPLTVETGFTLYKVILPITVYQHLTQADFGDMRVFDSAGNVLPSVLRTIAPQKKASQQVTLPLFPIYGKVGDDASNMSLRVQRNQQGAIVEIGSDKITKNERRIVGYLLDARQIKQPLHNITLHTDAQMPTSIQRVNVAYSDDLNHFTTVVSGAAIVNLSHDNYSVEKRDIVLDDRRANYWLLTWPDDADQQLNLASVTATRTSEFISPNRLALKLNAISSQPEKGEYIFKLEGHMPADGARIILPGKNQIVEAKLFSRASPDDKWRYQSEGLAYDLQTEGKQKVSSELRFVVTADQYWRLLTKDRQGENDVAPILELRGSSQELVFVANDKPPYLLAYGNGAIKTANFNIDELITKLTRADGVAPIIQVASVGEQTILGGEHRLASPMPWQKWLLWAVLIIGAALLIWMAVRLFRQVGHS